MGRGKVELKRIENNISRQVTFSKRRTGLLKKAQELSILCDAEIALVIFSSRGRLYHFSSFGPNPGAIDRTLERYRRSTITTYYHDDVAAVETQSWCQEVARLKAKYETLKCTQRHLLGEDLGPLNAKELQNLEKQLEGSLAQTRHRKTQLMNEQMENLRRKERHLGDLNKELKLKSQIEEAGVVAAGHIRAAAAAAVVHHQNSGGSCSWNTTTFGTTTTTTTTTDHHTANSSTRFSPAAAHLSADHHLPTAVPTPNINGGLDHCVRIPEIGYKPEPILEIGFQHYAPQEDGSSNPRGLANDFNQGWFL